MPFEEIKIDKIIRSRRRTMALVVTQEAQVVVRAPIRAADRAIMDFVRSKRGWVEKHRERFIFRNAQIVPKQFIEGEKFRYLGGQYAFKITDGRSIAVSDCFEFPKRLLPCAKASLVKWYKEQARQKITQRVNWQSGYMGLKCPPIRVSSAKTRWGSCGPDNSLNFCWRLVMAPPAVIDYVVAHELAHFKEKNHSRRFWELVGGINPDYSHSKRWLKDNGHLLVIQ